MEQPTLISAQIQPERRLKRLQAWRKDRRERERKRVREEKREDLEGLENLFFPQWEEKNEFLFRLH